MGGLSVCLATLFWAATAAADAVQVEVFPGAEAATAGQSVELAIRIKLPDGMCVGWEDGGDVPATRVRLDAGGEAMVERIRFPAPERHAKAGGGSAVVMTGEPIILATIRIPAHAAAASRIEVRGEATWATAALDETGVTGTPVPGRADLSVSLPVVAAGETPKAANVEVFEEAAYALPVEAGKAKHVKLAARHATGDGGSKVVLDVQVGKQVHIQAHDPGVEGLVGADVFVVAPSGMRAERPVFPAGKTRDVPYLGKVHEYEGKLTLEIPLKSGADASGAATGSANGPDVVRGVFRYQACDTKTNQCYPPEYLEWAVELPARGTS